MGVLYPQIEGGGAAGFDSGMSFDKETWEIPHGILLTQDI
jgi:hypothetical protein